MKNLLVAQSGGPTSSINATLSGIIAQSILEDGVDKIYGGLNGIHGIMQEKLIDLKTFIKNTSDLHRLSHTPASALGSCRLKLQDVKKDDSEYKKIINVFKKYDIKYFIYIGGNDSMDTVDKLSKYCQSNGIDDIKIIGAPKTIDNDLAEIDHCPGFPSAAKYIATTFTELERDVSVYDTFGVTIVEVMGRNAGWLTASSAIARSEQLRGPDLIYLCEKTFSIKKFLQDIEDRRHKQQNLLIAVSEGIKDSDGKYISERGSNSAVDAFGHKYIEGAGKVLGQIVREKIGCKMHSLELNLMQRCAGHLACTTDLEESKLLGAKAVQSALKGKTGEMVTLIRKSNEPYEIFFSSVPVSNVANREKTVPLNWINEDGTDVTKEMLEYLNPIVKIDPIEHFIIRQ